MTQNSRVPMEFEEAFQTILIVKFDFKSLMAMGRCL